MRIFRYDNLRYKYHGIAITGLKYVIFKCLGSKQQLFSPLNTIFIFKKHQQQATPTFWNSKQ